MSQDAAPQLDQILREAREAKGVTLRQAEAATRVRQKYLQSLEEGRWDSLPEPLYTKGFLKSYARYLGLDGVAMLALYEQAQAGSKTAAHVRPALSPLRQRATTWTGVLIGILVFAVFVIGLMYLYRQYTSATPPPTPIAIPAVSTPTPTVKPTSVPALEFSMPDTVGRELALVEADLRALGISVQVSDRRYDTRVAAGRVITQSVPAGARVPQGVTVTVVLSRGPAGVSVPNVVNIGFDQARGILAGAGLSVERRDTPSAQAAVGTVIRQEPAPLTAAQPGSTVVVYVSQGNVPTAGMITVPNVVGLPWPEAERILKAAGLKIISVEQQDATFVPSGSVLSTTPAPGTQVSPGSEIAVGVRR